MAFDHPGATRPSVQIQRFASGLQRRSQRLGRGDYSRLLLLVSDGEALLESEAGDEAFGGPAVAWRQSAQHCRLTLDAGAAAIVVWISEETLGRVIGDFDESEILHFLFARDWIRNFAIGDDAWPDLAGSLDAIADEVRNGKPGATMMIIALLRVLFVTILRASAVEDLPGPSAGRDEQFLQRFRQLVETHYRSRWPVARYAAELGITHDRLHAICRRCLDKPPKVLLEERLAREAAHGIERSSLTVTQMSYALGFRDPAHFSNFFKRMTGMAPGEYRKLVAAPAPTRYALPSFADWP